MLVNTDRGGEPLDDQVALDRHLNHFGWTGRRDRDDAELAAVRAQRQRLGPI